jgi:AcrR family transcriptional regulator
MTQVSSATVLRSRGRPPKSKADEETMKANIVSATIRAFAEHGYHNMTVDHVLANANISRPTFYKYFRQLEEPLSIASHHIHIDLIGRIKEALQADGDAILNAAAAFDVYVDWGKSLGEVLRPLYAEFYQTTSPISAFRLKTIDAIQKLIIETVVKSGRPKPTPLIIGLYTTGVEFIAFQYLLHSNQSEEAYAETRLTMFRLLIATLGTSQDYQLVMGLS